MSKATETVGPRRTVTSRVEKGAGTPVGQNTPRDNEA
jgi:hypothetical protein